jgi:U3 small nucleolar RNA-associated protein 22
MIALDNPMSLARTSPHQSNIRTGAANDTSERMYPASPLYNNALLLSFTPRKRLLSTHDTIKTSPAFVDALTLLRVWANQRGYGFSANSSTCIVGFENLGPWWATLVELLIFGEEASFHSGSKKQLRKALGTGLSSYQLFRAVIDFLGKCPL